MSENLLATFTNAILGNNLILFFLLGTCPLMLYQLNIKNSLIIGVLILFITLFSALIIQIFVYLILVPAGLTYFKIISVFLFTIVVIYAVRTVTSKYTPRVAELFDTYPEFFYTNYAIFGVIFLNVGTSQEYLHIAVSTFGYTIGYVLIMVVFYPIKEYINNKGLTSAQQTVLQITVLGLLCIVLMSITGLK